MNQLPGTIKNVTSSGNVSLVSLETAGIDMSAIILGTTANTPYLRPGKTVLILFKESEVSIGKNFSGMISLRNQIDAEIIAIERGEVFSKIDMEFMSLQITSLITTRSTERLELTPGDKVTAFIKSNEVMLMDPDNE